MQQERFGEEHAHPRGIEPGGGTGVTDEGDGAAHAEFLIQAAQLPSEACQGIEHMRQAHEEVIAPHGIPVQSKGMLIVVALVFLDEKARFDAPTVAGTEVAALMNVLGVERLAGEPGVAPRFGHGRGLWIDPLPAFLTDHQVQLETLTPVRTEGIVDVVDPGEVLSAFSPGLLAGLRLQGMQGVELLPDRGQVLVLEHDHELPVVGMTALHHRPIGVEAVEQEQDRQAGEQRLEPVAQARKAAQLAILLLRFGIAQRVFEELAEQRDDQAVVEGQAGLEDVDEVLGVTGFLLADGALQEFLCPEGVAGELLRAVDGDRIAVVDQVPAKALAADQPPDQIDVGLFEVVKVDVAQQPIQGVGVWQGVDLRKQPLQRWP